MQPFKSASLPHLPRRSLASRFLNGHVVKRRPTSRLLSTAKTLRQEQLDRPPRVMVYSRGFGRKRFVSWIFYSAASIAMFRFVGSKLTEVDEAAGELEGPDTETLEDGDEGPIFIALQYPKKLPTRFYKHSDPDWMEFISISKNKQRKQAIQKELAERVGRDISKHPSMSKVLGKNIKLSRYWLEFKYPDGPPPEYARTGIEISDEYLALSTQVIPNSYYIQLSHILWPKALFGAALTSLHMFALAQKVRIKNMFGLDLNQKEKHVQHISTALLGIHNAQKTVDKVDSKREKNEAVRARLEQQLKEAENDGSSETQLPTTDALPVSPATPSSTDSVSNISSVWTGLKRFNSSASKNSSTSSHLSWLPSPPIPSPEHVVKPLTGSMDIALAYKTFLHVLLVNWQKSKLDPTPDGSFFVIGEVEVSGDRARCKADVHAAYDPKSAKFAFVVSRVKVVWEHRQFPKGGR